MEIKHIFETTLYSYSKVLAEALEERNEDGTPKWKLSTDNKYIPHVNLYGQCEAYLVENVIAKKKEEVEKPPTKTELIEKELIEQFGEDQRGIAEISIQKTRKQRSTK